MKLKTFVIVLVLLLALPIVGWMGNDENTVQENKGDFLSGVVENRKGGTADKKSGLKDHSNRLVDRLPQSNGLSAVAISEIVNDDDLEQVVEGGFFFCINDLYVEMFEPINLGDDFYEASLLLHFGLDQSVAIVMEFDQDILDECQDNINEAIFDIKDVGGGVIYNLLSSNVAYGFIDEYLILGEFSMVVENIILAIEGEYHGALMIEDSDFADIWDELDDGLWLSISNSIGSSISKVDSETYARCLVVVVEDEIHAQSYLLSCLEVFGEDAEIIESRVEGSMVIIRAEGPMHSIFW